MIGTDEEAFLRAVQAAPNDPGPRLIYADWLDEHADPRGEFLRTEVRLAELAKNDRRRGALTRRLRTLRRGLDKTWLAAVDRPAIENCYRLQMEYECPKRWENLEKTEDATVRWCDSCRRRVHYCGSVAEAQRHAWFGDCVAVDTHQPRKPGDLNSPLDNLGLAILGRPAPPPLPVTLKRGRHVTVRSGEHRGMAGRIDLVDVARRTVIVRVDLNTIDVCFDDLLFDDESHSRDAP